MLVGVWGRGNPDGRMEVRPTGPLVKEIHTAMSHANAPLIPSDMLRLVLGAEPALAESGLRATGSLGHRPERSGSFGNESVVYRRSSTLREAEKSCTALPACQPVRRRSPTSGGGVRRYTRRYIRIEC